MCAFANKIECSAWFRKACLPVVFKMTSYRTRNTQLPISAGNMWLPKNNKNVGSKRNRSLQRFIHILSTTTDMKIYDSL